MVDEIDPEEYASASVIGNKEDEILTKLDAILSELVLQKAILTDIETNTGV